MIAHKHMPKIAAALMAVAVCLCLVAAMRSGAVKKALGDSGVSMGYETALFDTSQPLTVNILMDEEDWQSMLDNAAAETYYTCNVEINGEIFCRVGIRPKGNTSLTSIANDPTTDRYSFKLEFDQYVEGQTCYGLDKLVLNNNYADATYMKEALVYDMYRFLGADASLYNYAAIYVNGEYWGAYLALEAVEDSFLLHNYGAQSGALYKPEGVDAGRGGKAVTDFFDALLENETYRAQYEAYLRQLAEEYVQGGMLESFYTRTRSQIDQLVQDDPTAFYDYDAYDDAAQMLLQVVQLRGRSVLLQLSGAEETVDTTGIDLRIMGGMNGGFGGGEAPQGGPDRMS